MYYHCLELKYVQYGKVYPHFDPENDLNVCYRWLGFYCGYFPQIWLATGDSYMTGMRNKGTKYNKDDILFGFDFIRGFPVDYHKWHIILGAFSWFEDFCESPIPDISTKPYSPEKVWYDGLKKDGLDELVLLDLKQESKWSKEQDDYDESQDPLFGFVDLDTWLKQHLFVEKDQVVLPSLNLKSAKQVICRNEKQKKKLRKMGFIEDRIKVKNFRRDTF